ncbi:MAG: LysM peptidoglycan-binding domain-containing protein [Desulfuromonadales bacterium]|nr:LysM peptidoglycan-binding domain-containing protein [Desulfuromonadales bacterium]
MTYTLWRGITLLVFLLVSVTTNPAIAAEEQIYTIKKGDTLWDLSQRFIEDPYYWPNVWAKNPDITNPHLIFPGQKIQILDGRLQIVPAYPEAKDQSAATAEVTAPAAEVITVKTGEACNGFILTDEKPLGLLVDSVDNRILLTKHDIVFLKMKNLSEVNIGDTYGLYDRGEMIKHPHTKLPVGTMMNNLGFLEVTEISGNTAVAKIGGVFREITRGAELFEYVPQQQEITLQRGTTDQKGYIIAARDHKGTFSTNDIIYIDLGDSDGLAKGNLLYISRPRSASDEIIKRAGAVQIPDAVLGAAIVVETKAKTAAAIIIKSADAAFIGDNISVVTD